MSFCTPRISSSFAQYSADERVHACHHLPRTAVTRREGAANHDKRALAARERDNIKRERPLGKTREVGLKAVRGSRPQEALITGSNNPRGETRSDPFPAGTAHLAEPDNVYNTSSLGCSDGGGGRSRQDSPSRRRSLSAPAGALGRATARCAHGKPPEDRPTLLRPTKGASSLAA